MNYQEKGHKLSTFSKKAKGKVWETWTTTEGKTISVDQMTESHAKNVLNVLLIRNKKIQSKLDVLKSMDKDFAKFMKEVQELPRGV